MRNQQDDLPLEYEFQIRRVADQSRELNEDQLRTALLCAWSGWMTERALLVTALKDRANIEVHVGAEGFLPFQCCGIEN